MLRSNLLIIFSLLGHSLGYQEALPQSCPVDEACNLKIIHAQMTGITGICNEAAQRALAIDYDSNASIFFDGRTGYIIILHFDSNKGQILRQPNNDNSWLAKREPFENYFEHKPHIDYNATQSEAEFDIDNPPNDQIDYINDVIKDLEPEMESVAQVDRKSPLKVVIKVMKGLSASVKSTLWNIVKKRLNLKNCLVFGGLFKIVATFKGIVSLMGATGGRIGQYFLQKSFKFEPLFVVESAIQSLSAIFIQIARVFNPLKLFSLDIVNFPKKLYMLFIEIIQQFNGGIYKGIYGIEAFVIHLTLFIEKAISLPTLIDVVIQIVGSITRVTGDGLRRTVTYVIQVLNTLSTKYPSQIWQFLLKIFKDFLGGNLMFRNINICSITTILLEGIKSPIEVILKIFSSLQAIVQLPNAIAQIFVRIVYFIVSGHGLTFILKLIPDIKGMIVPSSGVSVIAQILKQIRLPSLLDLLASKSFEGIIGSVSILKQIFNAILRPCEKLNLSRKMILDGFASFISVPKVVMWIKKLLRGNKQLNPDIAGMGYIDGCMPTITYVCGTCIQ